MAGGSPQQERATDQQCEHCNRWFDGRGIDAHRANCDGPDDDDRGDRRDDQDAPKIFDPLAEQEVEPTETETDTATEAMSDPTCPDCDSTDDVHDVQDVKEHLAEIGELSKNNLRALEDGSHYCDGCNTVFSDE